MSLLAIKQVWQILQYYYCRQRYIIMLVIVGFIFFLLGFWTITFSEKLSFVVFMISSTFMFLVPFMNSCTSLRELISNHPLSLLPGFKPKAGIALLAMTILPSFWWSLNAWYFGNESFSIIAILRSFTAFSLFAGIMQLVLPSRYYLQIISILPVTLAIIAMQIRDPLYTLMLNVPFTWFLFILSLLGWVYGLRVLQQRQLFAPPFMPLDSIDYWSYDGGLFQKKAIGESRSASGTLLLGFPDGWKGILSRVSNYMVVTPLITVGFFLLIGFGENAEIHIGQSLFPLFLLISLSCSCAFISIFGEMAARCRLIWLRQGGSRETQWQTLEQLTLKILFNYMALAGLITLFGFVFSILPAPIKLHYFLVICSFSTFILYLSLTIRVFSWLTLFQAGAVILSVSVMITGIMVSINQNNYILITILEGAYLFLAFLLRNMTRRKFLGIDWFQVKFKRSKRLATG